MRPTFGGASVGGGALGTGPGAVSSGFVLRLAGVAVPAAWTIDALGIEETLNERAIATFTVVVPSGPAAVAPGTRVDIEDRRRPLFSGTVERTLDTVLFGAGRGVAIDVTAVDAAQILDRRLIAERVEFLADAAHPLGWHPGVVAVSLVRSYCAGEGLTTNGIDTVTSIAGVQASFEAESVAAALRQLAEATGWAGRVTAIRDVRFGPQTHDVAPLSITASSVIEGARLERTRERFRTVARVVGTGLGGLYGVDGFGTDGTSGTLTGWTLLGSATTVATGNPGPSARLRSRVHTATEPVPSAAIVRDLGLEADASIRVDLLGDSIVFPTVHLFVAVDSAGAGQALQMRWTQNGSATVVVPTWLQTTAWAVDPTDLGGDSTSAYLVVGSWTTVVVSLGGALVTATIGSRAVPAYAYTRAGPYLAVANYQSNTPEPLAGFPQDVYVDNVVASGHVAGVPLAFTLIASTAVSSMQAVEGGTGRVEAVTDIGSVRSLAEALAKAEGALRRFSVPPVRLTFATDTPGLRAGQLLPVDLPAFGLADDMLIEAVEIRRDGGVGQTLTRVTAVSDEQQGQADDFWRQALR